MSFKQLYYNFIWHKTSIQLKAHDLSLMKYFKSYFPTLVFLISAHFITFGVG